jgi:hypothetical protein
MHVVRMCGWQIICSSEMGKFNGILVLLAVQDRKVDVVFSLFEMLYFLRVRQGDVDKICWSLSKRCKFEGKSYYHVLTIPTGSPFPKSIWRVKTPSRITYFVWMATLGKILTLDYLRKRTFMVVE